MKYISQLKFRMTGGRAALLSAVIAAGIIPLGMSPKQELYCKIFSLGLCVIQPDKVHL